MKRWFTKEQISGFLERTEAGVPDHERDAPTNLHYSFRPVSIPTFALSIFSEPHIRIGGTSASDRDPDCRTTYRHLVVPLDRAGLLP